jgi:hypothetical protein
MVHGAIQSLGVSLLLKVIADFSSPVKNERARTSVTRARKSRNPEVSFTCRPMGTRKGNLRLNHSCISAHHLYTYRNRLSTPSTIPNPGYDSIFRYPTSANVAVSRPRS